jgi:hypothetical protein
MDSTPQCHHHRTLVNRRTSSLGAAALKGTWSWHYPKLQKLPWENPMVWAGLGHPFCRTSIYGFITVFLAKRDHFGIQNDLFLKKNIETSQTPSLALLWPIFGTILSHLFALLLVVPGNLCELSSFHPGCDSTGSIGKQFVLRSASRGAGNTFYVAIYATNA